MTFETAKRILEENNQRNKEAEAVVRGGMTICEITDEGTRKYIWIKVAATKTDAESSIKKAIEEYKSRERSKILYTKKGNIVPSNPIQTEKKITEEEILKKRKATTISRIISFVKYKMDRFLQLIDSLVVE